MKSKYVFLHLETRDGEREYDHKGVHKLPKDTSIIAWADDYCSDFWMGGSEKDGDGYYFHGGEIFTQVQSVQEIPKKHYDILKQYL